MNKSLLTHLGEAIDAYRVQRREQQPEPPTAVQRRPGWRGWLPSKGNVLFTLLLVGLLVLAQTVGALPSARQQGMAPDAPSTGTIAYQGRLADADGNPLTNTVPMIFRLYDASAGGAPLWEEQWTGSSSVQVSDGLFNVMLGSLAPIPASLITSHSSLFLGITVDTDDEMAPRVQLGSVPFAVQALTVPDGSVTTEKIADGAVTSSKFNLTSGLGVPGLLDVRVPSTDNTVIGQFLNANNEGLLVRHTGSSGYFGGKLDTVVLDSDYYGNGSYRDLAFATSNAIRLNIGADGKVGIGTISPASKLELEDLGSQNLAITLENNNTRAGLELESQGGTNNGEAILNLGVGTRRGIAPKPENAQRGWFRVDTRASSSGFYWFWSRPDGTDATIGSLDKNGNFGVTGSKSSIVATEKHGQRKLYAVESPDVRFSDEGVSHLKKGSARVALDPVFLETIEGEYVVHITPYGDATLYVAEIGEDYFAVKARDGDPNVTFAWRLSATRKGYAGVRLEEVK